MTSRESMTPRLSDSKWLPMLRNASTGAIHSGAYWLTWPKMKSANEMAKARMKATELAPDRIEFSYRYAESFYDLEKPDWDEALKAWAALEARAKTPAERETMRLQAANVLIKQGRFDHARLLLSLVTEPGLQGQKQKLVAQLPENAKK